MLLHCGKIVSTVNLLSTGLWLNIYIYIYKYIYIYIYIFFLLHLSLSPHPPMSVHVGPNMSVGVVTGLDITQTGQIGSTINLLRTRLWRNIFFPIFPSLPTSPMSDRVGPNMGVGVVTGLDITQTGQITWTSGGLINSAS